MFHLFFVVHKGSKDQEAERKADKSWKMAT